MPGGLHGANRGKKKDRPITVPGRRYEKSRRAIGKATPLRGKKSGVGVVGQWQVKGDCERGGGGGGRTGKVNLGRSVQI